MPAAFNGNICPNTNEGGDLGVAGKQWRGLTGKSRFIVKNAGASVSGHRILTTDSSGQVIYADAGTVAHANRIIGMATQAAGAGEALLVQTEGEHDEPSWSWTPGDRLYLGTNGAIQSTAPASGFVCQIGWAETATKVVIQIGQSLVLA